MILPYPKKVGVFIVSGVVIALSIALGYYYLKSHKLESDLKTVEVVKSQAEANNEKLKKSLDEITLKIKSNKVEYDKNLQRYEQEIDQIKTSTKYNEVKSNECEDIKKILYDIRDNGY